MCTCELLFLVLILVKNVFFIWEKGISKLLSWVAPKHTAHAILKISRRIQGLQG